LKQKHVELTVIIDKQSELHKSHNTQVIRKFLSGGSIGGLNE